MKNSVIFSIGRKGEEPTDFVHWSNEITRSIRRGGLIAGTYEAVLQRPKRTQKQNNLYFMVVGELANDLGYTKDELHEIIKANYLKRHDTENRYKKRIKIKKSKSVESHTLEYNSFSTTDLQSNEFSKLYDCLKWIINFILEPEDAQRSIKKLEKLLNE